MKKTIYGLTLLLMTTTAQADLTGNLGYMSEYHFRGILQKVSSVSGGLDYESGGFYVGSWAADVGDGLEVDGYFGYGTEVGDVDLSVGYTGYFYTGSKGRVTSGTVNYGESDLWGYGWSLDGSLAAARRLREEMETAYQHWKSQW